MEESEAQMLIKAKKDLKILVVVPRYNVTNSISYEYMFPLGLSYITAAIKKAGFNPEGLNLNHYNGSIENVLNKKLSQNKYDIVCTGGNALNYLVLKKITDVVKLHYSKPIYIMGGPIITSEPDLLFPDFRPDFAVLGEGEVTIVRLLEQILENINKPQNEIFANVEGIMYLKNGSLMKNPQIKQIENIDTIEFPEMDVLGYEEFLNSQTSNFSYTHNIFDYPRIYPILGSRSCPYHCTFCYHDTFYRRRSLDNIFSEIKYAVLKYKINVLMILDDCFAIDHKRVNEFCDRLKDFRENLDWDLKWTCQLTVHSAEKQLLKKMKESGCEAISYGFESYSPIVLKSMRKPITPQQIDSALKNTFDAHISVQGNFIFCDIAETKETAYKTLDYWRENCKGQVGLAFIQPYPGSEIWNYCFENGIIKDKMLFIKEKLAPNIPFWINMTKFMTDYETHKLKKDILKSQAQFCQFVVPKKLKKNKKNICEITVTCPHCGQDVTYKNFRINFLYIFFYAIGKPVICRNCNMRFFITSKIERFAYKHYHQVRALRDFLEILKFKLKTKS
ncbi:MAG TPA: radical SAM protein [Candidatus Woesearchaeota archaeon]|nr:radical SAM protein [Candidatus Woesearchaeota archaeon]